MRVGHANIDGEAIASALGWWAMAGVDVLVEDDPRDWFAPAPPIAPPPAIAATPTHHAITQSPIPDVLEALVAWLLQAETLPALGAQRSAPVGMAQAGAMALTDMPEPGDATEGRLLGGNPGRLFDAMLRAIGLDSSTLYLASLSPAWLPAGPGESGLEETLVEIAQRHVALAAPRAVLLLGDATTRALLGMSVAQARGRLHQLDSNGTATVAVATFHPRFLLGQPARKAEAWADLRLFSEQLGK